MSHNTAERGGGPRMPILVLVLGLAAIVMLVASDSLRRQADERGRLRQGAIDQIELDIAVSHLWLEEHVTGDQVDLDELDARLARAGVLASGLETGGPDETSPDDAMALLALREPALRHRAATLLGWIDEFRTISTERIEGYSAGQAVGIGSATDERYDAVFAELLDQSEALGASLEARSEAERDRVRRWFWALLMAWAGLIVATFVVLRHGDRRRDLTERALDASQNQLMESQKIEAVGRLAGGLAHDLNNYLAAIRGHCELVARRPGPTERVVAKMERVLALTGKASSLIDRLQGFTQRREPQREVLDLRHLIEALVAMVRPSVGEKIWFETEIAHNLRSVSADPAQLEQVMVNLIFNARDAMPEGGRIQIVATNHGSDAVQISVRDEGSGIALEIRERIFEPLVSTKEGSHTGLGLSIVHQIVTAHDGRIEVESTEGEGSVFTIDLPSIDEVAGRPAPVMERFGPLMPGPGADRLTGSEHLLLVDDNEDFRDVTKALLEERGYRVTVAAGGAEALAIVESLGSDVDLVLTDVVMPGMGGHELVERIRRQHDIKAIFLSGHSEEVLGHEGMEPGEAYVMKGVVSGDMLARRVRTLLDG